MSLERKKKNAKSLRGFIQGQLLEKSSEVTRNSKTRQSVSVYKKDDCLIAESQPDFHKLARTLDSLPPPNGLLLGPEKYNDRFQ